MKYHKHYLGPKKEIKSSFLQKFPTSLWVAEEKIDGAWACITAKNGKIESVVSRKNLSFSDKSAFNLIGMKSNVDFVIVGELEAATQYATKKVKQNGGPSFIAFDVVSVNSIGLDFLKSPYEIRRKNLEALIEMINVPNITTSRLITSNFEKNYEEIIEAGGEGIVLKKKSSLYRTSSADGKTDDWFKCKRFHTVDFEVLGFDKTDSGMDNLILGLNGERVQTLACPAGYSPSDFVGKIIECMGDSQTDSRALRFARFMRIRDDK